MTDHETHDVPAGEGSAGHERLQLGAGLRRARTRAGLTQRELASRLSLSPGMISQLEKGMTQPSVTTLFAMAKELGVSLDALLIDEDEPEDEARSAAGPGEGDVPVAGGAQADAPRVPSVPSIQWMRQTGSDAGYPTPKSKSIHDLIQRRDSRTSIKMGAGATWELLTPDQNHPMLFMMVSYAPGGQTHENGEFVRHSDVEYFVLIEGRLEVQIEFERAVLEAGDSMWFDSSRPHLFRNNEDVIARGVWFLLPH